MSSISLLPAPASAPPNLPSNTVTLYENNSWSSTAYTFDINDYAKNLRQSISGTKMQDRATWIAYNLPVGTVVTMTDNMTTPPGGNVYDLKGCGRVVDLVGTGRTVGVDLTQCNMNDCISSWFWHTPDMSIGGVELYDDDEFKGNRTVLFLSEWPAGSIIKLTGWYIADRASSVRWSSLTDAQMVSLFNNEDGGGSSYNNIKGWGSFKQIGRLRDVGFNDAVSSFSWNNLIPKQEVVEPAPIPTPSPNGVDFVQSMSGVNNSSEVQSQTISLDASKQQTTTVTVTNQYTAGMQMSYSIANEVKGKDQTKTVTWTIQLDFTYSRTESLEMTETKTTSIGVSQQYNVPPYSTYDALLTVGMGNLPSNAAYSTTAKRWYDQQLDGSTYDPANGWYVRTDTVTFSMGGAVAVGTTLDVRSTPL